MYLTTLQIRLCWLFTVLWPENSNMEVRFTLFLFHPKYFLDYRPCWLVNTYLTHVTLIVGPILPQTKLYHPSRQVHTHAGTHIQNRRCQWWAPWQYMTATSAFLGFGGQGPCYVIPVTVMKFKPQWGAKGRHHLLASVLESPVPIAHVTARATHWRYALSRSLQCPMQNFYFLNKLLGTYSGQHYSSKWGLLGSSPHISWAFKLWEGEGNQPVDKNRADRFCVFKA